MFLKSLTIKGFKSFADPVTLNLEPGITVVVGPNGSGKSNVVDAVAWVLGAQGPRMLRSSRMEDVIFLGTNKRQPLGRAEVSLTIDNSSHSLPIEVAEVTITRTLFRSGDSEYAINGASCRLLDVQELLSDAGVGRQQHVIVGQGQVEGVLVSRPEERRLILEEAAGVLKHRKRKERAERRLEATEENMRRITESLRELRRQARPLERQAASARAQVKLSEELAQVRLYVAGCELRELDRRAAELAARRAELQGEGEEAEKNIGRIVGVERRLAGQLDEARDNGLERDLGRAEGLRQRVRGLQSATAERLRSLQMEISASQDRDVVSMLDAEMASLDEEITAVGTSIDAAETRMAELAEEARTVQHELEVIDERWSAEAGAGGVVGAGGASVAHELAEVRSRLQSNERAMQRSAAGRGRLEARRSAVFAALEKLDAESTILSNERAEMAEQVESAAIGIEDVRLQVDQEEKAVRGCEAAVRECEDRHRVLLARSEALSLALRRAQDEGGAGLLGGRDGVLGTLAELIEVDPNWERAVEAALGPTAGTVVVAGREAGVASAFELVRAGRPGGLVVLKITSQSGSSDGGSGDGGSGVPAEPAREPGSRYPGESLRRHVTVKKNIGSGWSGRRDLVAALEQFLDARLASAVVVSDQEDMRSSQAVAPTSSASSASSARSAREAELGRALDVAIQRPDLFVITANGDRMAGEVLKVRSEMLDTAPGLAKRAQDEARSQSLVLERATAELAAARETLARSSEELLELRRTRDLAEGKLAAAEIALRRLTEERERMLLEERDLSRQIEDLSAEVESDGGDSVLLSERAAMLEEALRVHAEQSRQRSEARGGLEATREALLKEESTVTARLAALYERRIVLSERRAKVELRLAGSAAERDNASARRGWLEDAARQVQDLLAKLAGCAQSVAFCVKRLSELREQADAGILEIEQHLESLSQERGGLELRSGEAKEQLQDLAVRSAEDRLRREALMERIQRQLARDRDDALRAPRPSLPEGVTAEERERELEREIASMGPVNLLAVDELAELDERRRFVESQLDDVRSARRDLLKVVDMVDAEIASVFTSAFTDVNEHFSSLVSSLFPDGTGRLVLTDPANALETGVELEACLPGRRVRKLSLLSGGERSLVALAFLFAVFMARPSPFYLMDEVEAALDDVNLNRFVTLLDGFRSHSQLIVVSHQKRTMECADALFGVTMAPGESSKVVSERVRRNAGEDASSAGG